jgi:4-amino-4-deoxy-L-arabinose transferase-like glycosyltransferase
MEPAREVRFDILVSLFITATFYAFLRAMLRPSEKLPLQAQASQEKSAHSGNKAWYIAAGIFFGFAFLSKDVISAFAGVAVISYILASSSFHFSTLREFLLEKYVWLGALAALVVIVPWHLYETIRFGAAFWESYLGTEVFSRVSTDIFGAGVGPTNVSYVSYFFSAAAPWSELLLLGLVVFAAFWKKMPRVSRDVCIASLVTIFAIIAIMLSSHTKALSYLIPLYPFLAIFLALLGSHFWNSFLQHANKDEQRGAIAICVVVFVYCFYSTSLNVLHLTTYYQYELHYTKEEQAIGELIKASGPDPFVYAYNDYDMGTILYYSGLPFTKNEYVYLLSSSSQPISDSLVFMTSAANSASTSQELASALPEFSYTPLFIGHYVSLFAVLPQTLNSAHK